MMLTAKQVAEKLRVSVQTVRNMCEDGRLPGVNTAKNGSSRATWRVDEKALREWRAARAVARHKTPSTDDVPPGYVSASSAASMTGITASGIGKRVIAGTLKGVRVKRRLYVERASLTPDQRIGDPFTSAAPTQPAKAATPTGISAQLAAITKRLDVIEDLVRALHAIWS